MKQTIQGRNAVVYFEGKPIMQLDAVEIIATLHPRETVLTPEQIESFFPSKPKHLEGSD